MNENPLKTYGEAAWVVLGALLGVNGIVISFMLAGNFRKFRRFISANIYVWKYLGLASVGAGAALLYAGYSREIWQPCALLGVVLLACVLILKKQVRDRVREIEDSYMRVRNMGAGERSKVKGHG